MIPLSHPNIEVLFIGFAVFLDTPNISDLYAERDYLDMDYDEFVGLYDKGYDCAQSVVWAVHDKLGDDTEMAMKAASCLSMGLLEGSVCGGLLGAFVVIGIKFGSGRPDESEKGLMMIKREQFMSQFRKIHSGLTCPELMGLDVRKQDEYIEAYRTGKFAKDCPHLCYDIYKILDSMI
jgi:C_GCAxxG_C_C family probable redox protein